jgi:hypothetical protein
VLPAHVQLRPVQAQRLAGIGEAVRTSLVSGVGFAGVIAVDRLYQTTAGRGSVVLHCAA